MFTLYYSPGSASWVVHWLLIDLDLPHQLRRLDLSAGEQKTTEYLALNPQGVVPTMLVDGQPVSAQTLDGQYAADFVDISYDLPPSLTEGKDSIRVRFEPDPGHTAGPVFGLRLVKIV